MKIMVEKVKLVGYGLTNKGTFTANSYNICSKTGKKVATKNPKFKRLVEISKEEYFDGICKITSKWEKEVDEVFE